MKTMVVEYVYYGHKITQTIYPAEMINQLPPAARIETIIDIFEDLKIDTDLEPWQLAVLKSKFGKIESRLKLYGISEDMVGIKSSSIPKRPEPPLSRVLRQGIGYHCTNCGSTSSKTGFLGLFGERLCDNKKCPNSTSNRTYQ